MYQSTFNNSVKSLFFLFYIFFIPFTSAALPPRTPEEPFIPKPMPKCEEFEIFFYSTMQKETPSSFAEKITSILTSWQRATALPPSKEFELDPHLTPAAVQEILEKTKKHTSPIIAIQALILIQKVLTKNKKLCLGKSNAYRVFLVAYILAHKTTDDPSRIENLSWWAQAFHRFSKSLLIKTEHEFLTLLEWNTQVSSKEFEAFITEYWPKPSPT